MTTELRRVQTDAARQVYERNGNTEYKFLTTNPQGACDICKKLDGKVFKVKNMVPGANAPPMHPWCHCTTAPHWNNDEFDEWLNSGSELNFADWKNQKDNSVAKKSGSGIMKMNLKYFAKIPEEKFTKYALNYEKAPDKAKAFEAALGYTKDNYQDLIDDIAVHFDEEKLVEKGDNGFGMRYSQVMNLTGPNGKTAKVLTAWIYDEQIKNFRLTSAYIDKR